jgi:hypothetical protein
METLVEKYKEYLDLNYTKSLQDPEENPYDSKYKARDLLTPIKSTLDKSLNQKNETLEPYFISLNSFIEKTYQKSSTSYLIEKLFEFNLAKNFNETDEYERGERILGSLLIEFEKLVENQDDTTHAISNYNPIFFNLLLNCLNELVFVWSHRSDYEKCVSLLNKTKELYDFYKSLPKNEKFQVPFDFHEIIEFDNQLTNEKRELIFESLYTHSLYYMAQIYGKLGEKEKSAFYCQLTLQRQIEFNNTYDDDNNQSQTLIFDAIDWATHAAALSQFYICEDDFSTSRHCLYCAEALLSYVNENRMKYDEVYLEKLDLQCASIKRCWGKYGLGLLKYSKGLLLVDTLDTIGLTKDYDRAPKFNFNFKNLKTIPNFDKYLASVEQSLSITTNLILDYDQAKKLFIKIQKILNESMEYFKLDGYVTDHCEIVHDLSELYMLLIFYEPCVENKSKMFKRRLDLLKPIVDEINEQFYLMIKRQFLFDCADVYQQMLDIKLEFLEEKRDELSKGKREVTVQDKTEVSSIIAKINKLAIMSIQHYCRFIDTMRSMPDRVKLPDKVDTNNVRPLLLAHFYIGRLYSKIITGDGIGALANTKKSLEYYSYMVDYCERHKDDEEAKVMEMMKVEYNVCKEMIAFMPVKMENLRKSIKY